MYHIKSHHLIVQILNEKTCILYQQRWDLTRIQVCVWCWFKNMLLQFANITTPFPSKFYFRKKAAFWLFPFSPIYVKIVLLEQIKIFLFHFLTLTLKSLQEKMIKNFLWTVWEPCSVRPVWIILFSFFATSSILLCNFCWDLHSFDHITHSRKTGGYKDAQRHSSNILRHIHNLPL